MEKMTKRAFRVDAIIYMPMKDGETQEQAEDRFLETIEDAGMEVYAWTDTHIAEQINLR